MFIPVFALAALLLLGVASTTDAAAPLSVMDFAIVSTMSGSTVRLAERMEDVLQALGKPIDTLIELKQPPAEGLWDIFRYQYDKLTIGFMRNWPTVMFIKLETADHKTPRKIGIGDSDGDVLQTYGKPSAKSGTTIVYQIQIDTPDEPDGNMWY